MKTLAKRRSGARINMNTHYEIIILSIESERGRKKENRRTTVQPQHSPSEQKKTLKKLTHTKKKHWRSFQSP